MQFGFARYQKKVYRFVDIPGTYSLLSNSEEEEIARDYICFSKPDLTVIILDATCLERSLSLVYQTLELTPHVLVCVNLLDEAKRKNIQIDLKKLSALLGVPVIGTIARKKKTVLELLHQIAYFCTNQPKFFPKLVCYEPHLESGIHLLEEEVQKVLPPASKHLTRWVCLKLLDGDSKLISSIQTHLFPSPSEFLTPRIIRKLKICQQILSDKPTIKESISTQIICKSEEVAKEVVKQTDSSSPFEEKFDSVLTSKIWGIPIMLGFLGIILWITIIGANYPSQLLSDLFAFGQEKITYFLQELSCPSWLHSLLMDGIYTTVTWVVSVMLPPMAIFFPLFTLLEDCGFLPRIAFNLDCLFQKAGSSRETSTYHVHGSDKVVDF